MNRYMSNETVTISLERYESMYDTINDLRMGNEIFKKYSDEADEIIKQLKTLVMESNYIDWIDGEYFKHKFTRYEEMIKAGITDDELIEFMKGKKNDTKEGV